MTYPESVRYLLSLLGDIRRENFGLGRMRKLLARLGDPQHSYRVVHVAGTNGKGSTAAMIEAGLRAAGFRTGLYTSPHLIRFNERLRIDGKEIDDAAFAACVEAVRAANEALLTARGRQDHPTFFETVTAVALYGFRRARVDWGVIEVGLGGRLDATNVVRPEAAVITRIGLDHEAFLGKGIEAIAGEKAGILKAGARAVLALQQPEASAVIERRAHELGVPVVVVGRDWGADDVRHEKGYYRFGARRAASTEPRSVEISLGLAGEHQVENGLTALAALDLLGVEAQAIRRGVADVEWPARLERIAGDPEILLDAAHNPSGAATLARFLEKHEQDRRRVLVYGAARDKAVEEVASLLFPCADHVILTQARVQRAVAPKVLLELTDHLHERIEPVPEVSHALERARALAGSGGLVVIAGSVFLVGDVKAVLEGAETTEGAL
jgi:dihydrofolate synthase/folylpolyglutamate synthase